MPNVTITSPDGMTPEELQAGLESGRFKHIRNDEQVNIKDGDKFMAVPRSLMKLDLLDEGISHPIPPGAKPRILDHVSVVEKSGKARAWLHRAHHFALGFEASQFLLMLCRQDDLLDQMQRYAPHPFDDYSVSLWTGSQTGMVECFLQVAKGQSGQHSLAMFYMEWGKDTIQAPHADERAVLRDVIYADDAIPADTIGWRFNDAFRVLMTRQSAITINKGGAPRHSLRKGKRVTFYSASEIKIDLDAVKREITHMATGHGRIMPVYQYRAHLCHSGGLKGCEHEWIEIGGRMDDSGVWIPDNQHPRDNATWECYHCGRRRWHRRAGTRGSAEVGYVRQTYKVVKGDDE